MISSLFSDFDRIDGRLSGHAEPSFAFLDRVAHPAWDVVRATLDGWFSKFPEEKRGHLRRRFRNTDDNREHVSALWELVLFHLLTSSNFDVQVEPKIDGRLTPDFLVTARDGSRFIVEAATMNDPDEVLELDRIEGMIYDCLADIRVSNFFARVKIASRAPSFPDFDAIRVQVGAWASDIDTRIEGPEDVEGAPSCRIEDAGWDVDLRASSTRPARPGSLIGMFDMKVEWAAEAPRLRKRLGKKRDKYGHLEVPLVLAVLSTTKWIDDWHITNALYGQEAVVIDVESDEAPRMTRQPDGMWFTGEEWGSREISAVLTAKLTGTGFLQREPHTLWLHPDALRPMSCALPWASVKAPQPTGEVATIDSPMALDDLLGDEYVLNHDPIYQWQRGARDEGVVSP